LYTDSPRVYRVHGPLTLLLGTNYRRSRQWDTCSTATIYTYIFVMTHTRKRPKYYFRNALAHTHTHTQRDALSAKRTRATYCIIYMRFPQKFTTIIIIITDVQSQSSSNSARSRKKETLDERECLLYFVYY